MRNVIAILSLGLTACGGGTAVLHAEGEVWPEHPGCEEACRGHCDEGPGPCVTRCERECAPAEQPVSDAERVQRFVEAVQQSTDARPLPDALESEVAWRVYLHAVAASGLVNVAPTSQPELFGAAEAELARSDASELHRVYTRGWHDEIGPAPCTVSALVLEDNPFVLPPSIIPELRARLEPELARAVRWQSAFEVLCGDRSFRVVVLPDEPAIVPLL